MLTPAELASLRPGTLLEIDGADDLYEVVRIEPGRTILKPIHNDGEDFPIDGPNLALMSLADTVHLDHNEQAGG